MINSHKKIRGASLHNIKFTLKESHQQLNTDYISTILSGDLAAYRINNFLSLEHCKKISENFWNSPNKIARAGYGQDGVEGYLIGASHIEKDTQKYLNEVQQYQSAVALLYKDTLNPLTIFREKLTQAWGNRINIRPAELNGLSAGHSKAVYWNNPGQFILEPHDDLAQLRDHRQSDFEIQNISRVMAVNFYPQVAADSGQLQIWNIEPDDDTRADLNLSFSGFPYSYELLKEFENLTISINTGDMCIINGNLIHAVLKGKQMLNKNRLLITCFMGLKSDNELIWWT